MDLPRLKIGTKEDYSSAYIKEQERYTHIFVPGKSGGGKSVLLANWWDEDELYRNAKIGIEPSGFLARDWYSISRGRAIYCSLDHPQALNPFRTRYRDDVKESIIAEAFNKVISITSGSSIKDMTPKMRNILHEELHYCLSNNRLSLLNVRDRIANRRGENETRDGLLSRMNFILNNRGVEEILCGRDSVSWEDIIEEKKTFILDASDMSWEQMTFIGTTIALGLRSYMRHSRLKKFKPCSVFIDECQNFITSSFIGELLREGRKYKLSCILATQQFSGMDENLVRSLLNCGSIVSFRVGSREAGMVARELNFPQEQLQFLEKHWVVYLSGNETGIAKAPMPPIVKPLEPKRPEPKRTLNGGWFPLEHYQL
jgi:hypothetical protein